jgi:hypothetical protein
VLVLVLVPELAVVAAMPERGAAGPPGRPGTVSAALFTSRSTGPKAAWAAAHSDSSATGVVDVGRGLKDGARKALVPDFLGAGGHNNGRAFPPKCLGHRLAQPTAGSGHNGHAAHKTLLGCLGHRLHPGERTNTVAAHPQEAEPVVAMAAALARLAVARLMRLVVATTSLPRR